MIAALVPVLLAIASFLIRVINLGTPKGFVFDEVYYVDGARDFLKYGVEVTGNAPEFIVHPPLGKWCIALGIKLFGNNEFGWRIAVALAGTLIILLISRIAHVIFYSPFLTALAAALASFDGLLLVHSRTALLDLFLTLFILCATYLWFRKKYWASGIFFGLSLATKWSAIYFLALFAIVALYRVFTEHSGKALIKPTLKTFAQFGLLPICVYISSWIGWFSSSRGWDRHWSSNPFTSLWHYHAEILNFHVNLSQSHPYQSNPWSWLIMGRPTSFFYDSPKGCGAKNCAQEVIALGTPILWWIATLALIVLIGMWSYQLFHRRVDKNLSFIIYGIAAGYFPWFLFQKRTMFTFYAIVFEPFLILAIVYCAREFIDRAKNRFLAHLFVLGILAVIFINFLYFYPIFTGDVITYNAWLKRMWFPSWI
ncbi:unannotated protein [freshwater metagenome]|uniref:Unannotated protein n=1 Tax=freshwater metagenome TaxID=449393 RepID=A0A6J7XTZ7_9ZZZZ|nr:phospholipid carrier-dependent glycosyltransferase [Actinomycetota bacterium]